MGKDWTVCIPCQPENNEKHDELRCEDIVVEGEYCEKFGDDCKGSSVKI